MPGTEGNAKASAWVASEFRRVGLQPLGDSGTFFQTLPFQRTSLDSSSRLEVNGARLEAWRDFASLNLAVASAQIDGAQVIYGGPATDQSRWVTAEQAAGKFVVFDVPASSSGTRTFVRGGELLNGARFRGAAAVAIAQLDVMPPEITAQLRGSRPSLPRPRVAGVGHVLMITPQAARTLLGAAPESMTPGASGATVRGDLVVRREPFPFPARNVVAVLPGSDPAVRGQYVSITAHNDHVGFDRRPVDHDSVRAFNRVVRPMGADSPPRDATPEEWRRIRQTLDSLRAIRPPRLDSIRNGADDDGTGTVALLEIAEMLTASGQRPKRSILFVSHTAEEMGLLGSQWFTDHPTVPLDSIVVEMDMDMIGRGNANDLPEGSPGYLERIGTRRLSTEFGDILDAVNARQPMPFAFNDAYDAPGHPLQYYCRADHYSYARYGIPSIAFSRGEHLDYHQVTDEAQYIDYAALARVATFVRDAALTIANLDHRVVRDKPKGDPRAACRQ